MCKQLQWVFALCDLRICPRRGKAAKIIDVKLCELFTHHPPFRSAFWKVGLPYCTASVERREIPAKCYACFEAAEKAAGRGPGSWHDYIKPIADDLQVPEFVWLVNISPYIDPLFRAVDWKPKPRRVPLESSEVSPRSQSPFPNTPAGVLNGEYDARDWKPVDKDRQIRPVNAQGDPPIAYWPRPRKPPGDYTGPASEVPLQVDRGTLTRGGWVYCAENVPLPESMKPLPREPFTPKAEASHPPDHAPKRKTSGAGSDEDSPTKKRYKKPDSKV